MTGKIPALNVLENEIDPVLPQGGNERLLQIFLRLFPISLQQGSCQSRKGF